MKNSLSKTEFLYFLDAHKHLWAYKNSEIDIQEIDVYNQHLIDQGYEVEMEAEQFVFSHLKDNYEAEDSDIILQERIVSEEFIAKPDVLIKNKETGKWDMYEIKSSTKVDKQNKHDATFQALVVNTKYELGDIYILHLNKDYIREGDLSLIELFDIENITEDVEKLKDDVQLLRYEALDILNEKDPTNVMGCIRPKTCPCLHLCHPDLPDYSIFDINNFTRSEKKVRELLSKGILDVKDVPSDFPLTDDQKFQVQVAKIGNTVKDIEKIKEDFSGLTFPLYFIDYETFNPAIPPYNGYRPYWNITFQWSLHILKDKNSKLEHHEFLWDREGDPTFEFLTSLKNVLGREGSIIVWNKSFEATRNREMATIHPEFEEFVIDMNNRIYDLMDIFKKQWYADPSTKGSYSIKKVLPALVPEFSYDDLDISEGATAMTQWQKLVFEDIKEEEKGKIKNDLLEYCKMDTLAMVKIWEVLQKLIR